MDKLPAVCGTVQGIFASHLGSVCFATFPGSCANKLRNILMGVCSLEFCNHILGYGERRLNHTLGYGKWVKIKPLTIGNVTKLTTFEAILHEMVELGQNGQNLLKIYTWLWSLSQNKTLGYGNLAKNRPLATEIGLKKGPLRVAHPSKVHITSTSTSQ